jgi:hypothetical protein
MLFDRDISMVFLGYIVWREEAGKRQRLGRGRWKKGMQKFWKKEAREFVAEAGLGRRRSGEAGGTKERFQREDVERKQNDTLYPAHNHHKNYLPTL